MCSPRSQYKVKYCNELLSFLSTNTKMITDRQLSILKIYLKLIRKSRQSLKSLLTLIIWINFLQIRRNNLLI